LACGARFVAVGLDAQLLTRSSRDLAVRFKSAAAPATRQGGSY
jgi:2-keto-3-deoxy-L-rhamnonate aldolase RhmA